MEESAFVSIFEQVALEVIGNAARVKKHENLFYELYLNRELKLAVPDTRSPSRGTSAFQTDICIFELLNGVEFPRVAIEFKTKITTHDILTYSAKAGKHKQIYPCLRYGLLASELSSIPGRFFIHNENIDFFIAAQKYIQSAALNAFVKELIEKEIEASRTLEKIHFADLEFDYFQTQVKLGKFGEN